MDRRMGRSNPPEEHHSYDAVFPSLGASTAPRQRPEKQRKKITPTPTAAAPVDSTFLLAQPSTDTDASFGRRGGDLFGRQAKPLEVDLRLLLKEKRGRQKGLAVQDASSSGASGRVQNDKGGVEIGGSVGSAGTSEKSSTGLGARAFEGQLKTTAWGQGPAGSRGFETNRSNAWGQNGSRHSDASGAVSEGLQTPPKSGQTPSSAPNEPSPLETKSLQTPTAVVHAQTPSPQRQLFRATSPGVSSPARLPENPPKLAPRQERAAQLHAECLRMGKVSSLLRELQTIVELLTAEPTSCGANHGDCNDGEAMGATPESVSISVIPVIGNGVEKAPGNGRCQVERDDSNEAATGDQAGERALTGSEPKVERPKDRFEHGLQAPAVTDSKVDKTRKEERTPQTSPKFGTETRAKVGADGVPVFDSLLTTGVLAFCCGDMAAAYACAVLEQSQPLILHCGEPILTALLQEPAVARHSQSLRTVLQGALTAHQTASLRGLGTPQKGGVSKGRAPLSALPFDEEQDSRNIPVFKTQEGQRLFSNREECRDVFYRIIRDAATTSAGFSNEPLPPSLKSGTHQRLSTGSFSGSFGKAGFSRPENALGFPASVRQLLAHLHGSNYPWLAKLFVQQIIQVASTGETDAEVRNLARENTAKLQRLHSRLMGAGGAPLRLAAGGTPSPGRRFKGLESLSPLVLSGGRKGSPGLESRLRGVTVEENNGNESVVGEGLRDGVSASKGKAVRDQGQTVRRTLAEVFGESEGGNAEGGPCGGVFVGLEGGNGVLVADGGPKRAWTQRPVSSTVSSVAPSAPVGPSDVTRNRLSVDTTNTVSNQASFASFAQSAQVGEQLRTGLPVAVPRPHEPAMKSGLSSTDSNPATSAKQPDPAWRTGLSVAVSRPHDPLSEEGPFAGLFSRSLLPYVRVLQAADSHRLHVLLTHCITDSITSLSSVGPGSPFSSSSFSERLVTLQTLARFLGFLLFAPVSTGHSALPTDPSSPVYTWSGELPLSLVDALRAAAANGSLLLTLPWVLEVLGMMRGCAPARKAPAFMGAIAEVGRLRELPALLPCNPGFGLPSLCITAALDGFFREDPLPAPKLPQNPKPLDATWPPRDSPDSLPGLIDARYIQNCCPLMEDLAATLVEARRARQMGEAINGPDASAAGDRRTRPIRKITPTPPAQAAQPGAIPADLLAVLPKEDADLVRPPQRDPLRSKLEGVFFEQQPQLRRLVDFVVDSVAANSALAAQLATCPDVIKSARAQILARAEEDATDLVGLGSFEVFLQQTILTACRESLPRAIVYARKHSQERVCEALCALARPNIPPPILGTAAAVAAQASAVGAVKIVLANVPKEIRQRLLEDGEKAKRKLMASMKSVGREREKATVAVE